MPPPPSTQIFDPDGDLTLIMYQEASKAPDGVQYELPHKTPAQDLGVRFQASSKHVILASTVFKAMLQPSFEEGKMSRADGKFEISLLDDSHVAFTILMDILHGRGRRVPRRVPFRLLVLLALLVNKYQLHEAVYVFVESWMQGQEAAIEKCSNVDLIYWLSISWVFRHAPVFNRTTLRILKDLSASDCEEAIKTIEQKEMVPLPLKVLDHIEKQRQTHLEKMYNILLSYHDLYKSPKKQTVCTLLETVEKKVDCDTLVLGSLIRSFSKLSMWPPPTFPCHGLALSKLRKEICLIKVASLCDHLKAYLGAGPDYHSVKKRILMDLDLQYRTLVGLVIKEFPVFKN